VVVEPDVQTAGKFLRFQIELNYVVSTVDLFVIAKNLNPKISCRRYPSLPVDFSSRSLRYFFAAPLGRKISSRPLPDIFYLTMPSDLSLPRRLHHLPRYRTRGAQSPSADRPSASLLCVTPAPSLGARRPSMDGFQTLLHSIAGRSHAPGLSLSARCARYSLGSCPPASLLVLSGQPRSPSMAELVLRASLSPIRELSVSLRTAASPLPGRGSSKLLAARPSARHFIHGRRPPSSPYARTSARISSGPRAPLPRPCPPHLSLSLVLCASRKSELHARLARYSPSSLFAVESPARCPRRRNSLAVRSGVGCRQFHH
jgi:hypothetical protein